MKKGKSIYDFYQENKVMLPNYSKTRLYRKWASMKNRCNRPSHKDFHNYGGRGIKVCDEWNDFSTFAEWAISNGYTDGVTLDRIDNNKGYSPDNCRFVDYLTQENNRRNNRMLSYNNQTFSLAQWARITGLKENCIRERLRRGWSVEKTLSTLPVPGRWSNHE